VREAFDPTIAGIVSADHDRLSLLSPSGTMPSLLTSQPADGMRTVVARHGRSSGTRRQRRVQICD